MMKIQDIKGNAFYFSVKSLLSARPLHKTQEIKTYRTSLREQHKLQFSKQSAQENT
jgi:hypothetical protein